jgi:hypothetical protein
VNPILALALVDAFVLGIVEKGQQAVVILLSKRIELVVMALSAGKRSAQPDRSRGVNAIDE